MNFVVLFGLPGTGKTFVGNVLKGNFGYHFYDGDASLTQNMRRAIERELPITDSMRDSFFAFLLHDVQNLSETYERLVVAQTFIKEKYRERFLQKFPSATFILVETNDSVRKKRLSTREDFPLGAEYEKKMSSLFEKPRVSHLTVSNNAEGDEAVREQIHLVLGGNSKLPT